MAHVRSLVPLLALLAACAPSDPGPVSIRLVDEFDAERVEGSVARTEPPKTGTAWRFDGEPPAGADATRGFRAGPGVEGLAIRDGMLVGRTNSDFPVLAIERTKGLDDPDQLHAVEIRMRVSAGANLTMQTRPSPTVDLTLEEALGRRLLWTSTSPVVAGDRFETYLVRPPAPVSGNRIRHLLIRPSDAAGAEFAIESVRLVFEREHLAAIPSGIGWHGLRDIFRETVVTRAPERVRFDVTLPSRPVLDLALGSPDDEPTTFTVSIGLAGGKETPVLSHSVTTPHRWERRVVDLARFAGRKVSVTLASSAAKEGTLAFWGAPAIRQRVAQAASAQSSGRPPQVVILIQGDTLRKDHLEVYGYSRPTAPTLTRLAGEGALFDNAITQTGWTKAATPAILTGLYPSTHGVHKIPDRLPAGATTIAELYRSAGYATLSFSSVPFTGKMTNLHQGFEELHESESTVGRAGPQGAKTAREYVDRLLAWLDQHPDLPVFVYLHVFDPHAPYEPNRPYDTMWAKAADREEYVRQQGVIKSAASDAFLGQRGMATRDELVRAGLDPEFFLQFSKDWYDGSIRGMDRELARLVERLGELGLAERTLLAFFADHGEEFHDHGRMWHGQSVYGEMIRVPLLFWSPGRVGAGLRLAEPAQLVDLVPTLAELSGLAVPEAVQGRSLRPLLVGDRAEWRQRPVFAEKQSLGGASHPNADEAYTVIDDGWKLIQNVVGPEDRPEFELFSFDSDPLDQKNVAAEHPEVVERLAQLLGAWRKTTAAARLEPDAEAVEGLEREQLEQLRSLGYIN